MEMGIGNISANNGWAMFVVGYATVIVALAVLAGLISLMPKIIIIQETLNPFGRAKKEGHASAKVAVKAEAPPPELPQETLPGLNVMAIATEYGPYINQLESPFELQKVYAIARENDLEHPHLSIRTLLETGRLAQESDGRFKWNA